MELNLIKTRNIRLIFYSIIRQLKRGDKFTYIIDGEESTIKVKKRSEIKNFKLVMKEISSIRRSLATQKQVVIKINNQMCCSIRKNNNEYYIDNANKILEYVVFEIIQGCTDIGLISKHAGVSQKMVGYSFRSSLNVKSQFFCDKTVDKVFYNLIASITREIIPVVFEKDSVTLITKRDRFKFSVAT